jgi:amino acid permease
MEKIEREIKRLEKRQHVIDMVFGSLIGVGLFVTCVVCPLLMHLS